MRDYVDDEDVLLAPFTIDGDCQGWNDQDLKALRGMMSTTSRCSLFVIRYFTKAKPARIPPDISSHYSYSRFLISWALTLVLQRPTV